jgi:hypothetical protein
MDTFNIFFDELMQNGPPFFVKAGVRSHLPTGFFSVKNTRSKFPRQGYKKHGTGSGTGVG